MKNFLKYMMLIACKPRDYIYCLICGLKYSPTMIFYGLPYIKIHKNASIRVGENFTACSRLRNNSIGVNQKISIRLLTPESSLVIGDNVGISGASISVRKNIRIGNNVLIGSGALIMDNDAHPLPLNSNSSKEIPSSSVVIDDFCFIGARSIILKGVHLGQGCIVGSGAVVTRSAPDNSILVGNPAKVINKNNGI